VNSKYGTNAKLIDWEFDIENSAHMDT